MATITVIHDCDVERRGDGSAPRAQEGDFRDCTINEELPGTPSNNASTIIVQFLSTDGKTPDEFEKRALLRYDLLFFLPSDAVMTAATWRIKIQGATAVAGQTFYVKRIIHTNWLEVEATWNDRRQQANRQATGGGNNFLDDTGESWPTDHWANGTVKITSGTGAGQTRTIASNTATRLTVTSNWATNPDSTSFYEIHYAWTTPGGDTATPEVSLGDITTTGWKSFDIKTLVDDAWDNRSGILTFLMFRKPDDDGGADGGISFYSKFAAVADANVHHLRITYTLDSKTFEAFIQ